MGYEGSDRRYGGERFGGDRDRGPRGYGQYGRSDREQEVRSYGGGRDYGRYGSHDHDDHHRDLRGHDQDRGFFERAGDEVRSWFGDDEAEQRRRRDEREDERYRGGQGRGQERSHWRGYEDRQSGGFGGRQSSDSYAYGLGGGYGSSGQQSRHEHDPHYRTWRDRQIESLDRDYDEYRRETQSRFESEFGSWRQTRQGQRDQLKKVREHQEVVGSDGQHVGTVDHIRGDRILLTKNDQAAGGRHHSIPCSWIQSVDEKVTISKTADQAKQHWRDEERDEHAGGGILGGNRDREGDRGGTNLNRSFSGTY